MPAAKRKVDPEAQKSQFEEWKQKDEFRIWTELQSLSKEIYPIYNKDFPYVTETTIDLTGRWQNYHDKLFEMVQIFKAKTKLKDFKHEHIRSFFFAQQDQDMEKGVVQKYIIDGFHCSVDLEYAKASWHLRKKFCEIHKLLEDVVEINAENFLASKKTMQKAMNEFIKDFQKHVKGGHKQIYDERLMMILAPLRNLLEINRRLYFFDMKNKSPSDRLINDFILKADVDKYCICLQDCQRLLFNASQIVANPDVKRIFNKLAYKGWHTNNIEKFYLMPLQKAFDRLKVNLLCLMVKGINYYNIPIQNNKQFLDDLKEVINCELISEHLLGDILKKDQINFMYNVQSVIFEANPLSKEYLLQKDPNSIEGAIPKLVVYLTILHMRKWQDKKAEDQQKIAKEQNKVNLKSKKDDEIVIDDKQQTLSQSGFYLSPEKKKQIDDEAKRQEQLNKALEEQTKIQGQVDQEKYGRYWIWDYYCDAQHRVLFDECVDALRHVNEAVQQDIQDEIIREGMIPRKDRQSKELKEASENLNKLRSKDNANVDSKMRRPPELWNYPKIIIEKHDFRSIADPKKCYIDGRIESLEHKIKTLSEHLVNHKPQSWKELVDRVVDALKGTNNNTPSVIELGK